MHKSVFNSWNDDAVSDKVELLKTHTLTQMIQGYGKLSVEMDGRHCHFQLLCPEMFKHSCGEQEQEER